MIQNKKHLKNNLVEKDIKKEEKFLTKYHKYGEFGFKSGKRIRRKSWSINLDYLVSWINVLFMNMS